MTSQIHTLPPDVVAVIAYDAALTDEAKVDSLATALVLEDRGPLARRLMALPMPETDPCSWSEIQDAVTRRRELLHGTDEWRTAERLLSEASGARPA